MEKRLIITISREYGSGGRLIGEKLAKKLNVPFYDNQLITLAAEKTGLSKECFAEAESTSTSNLLLSLTTLTPSIDAYGLPLSEKIYLVQSQIIKEVAAKGSCVIVGRSADYVLANDPDCVRIFIIANFEDRVKRAVENYGLSQKNAEASVTKTDKRRAGYYNFFTGQKWGRPENYDLVLNSSRMDLDKIVEVIESYIALKD